VTNEKPILFSAPMVRAILSGTKTQTRRVVSKKDPRDQFLRVGGFHAAHDRKDLISFRPWNFDAPENQDGKGDGLSDYCCVPPYGRVGERLWVRESIRLVDALPGEDPNGLCDVDCAEYMADGSIVENLDCWPWKRNRLPSIHMPRGLCRIMLEIIGIRVERLQDISEEDAMAEGVTLDTVPATINGKPGAFTPMTHKVAFAYLWNQINGKRAGCSWADNPWVWVVAFKCLEVSRG
jgi:hypothetical protein